MHLPSHLLALLGVLLSYHLVEGCAGGEWKCEGEGDRCISLNKFCDGIEHCDDGSDEPLGCTNCNRTFYGEANVKYPLRVTGPFQRYLPFVCKITFVAAGREYGDFVELTFLSFQIGTLELTINQTSICQKGHLKISEWSDSRDWEDAVPFRSNGRYSSVFPKSEDPHPRHFPEFGKFCGSMIERSVTFFSQGNNVSVTAVVPSRASIPSTSFGLYLTYRFLKHRPGEKAIGYLGETIPGTYCDREFLDCHSNRKCKIRTPNFPGFYPRNITCNYYIRQPKAPEGYAAKIVLSQTNDYKISVPTGRVTSTSANSFMLSTDCISGDTVRIHDGTSTRSPLLLEFCGSGALPEIVSSNHEVLVQIVSAPYQHLIKSRVEIDVSVRYEMVQTENQEDNGRCSYTLDGNKRRWGLIHSPKHTMPQNANCSYRLVGANKHDRVWLYFISFFVLVEKKPTSSENDLSCTLSRLEIYDLEESKSNVSSAPEPSFLFCGDTGPRLCAHAADYPPRYMPPRPCGVPGESYLSSSSEVVIRHRFLSFASELITSSTSSFTARYEFIDTRQQGTQIDHSECNRRIDSRLGKTGAITNPRNVFLYGRGGRSNITCMYHFVGLPSERLRITIKKASLKSGQSTCRTVHDHVLHKSKCRFSNLASPAWALLGATEFWSGYSSPVGCVCDTVVEEHVDHLPVYFESLVSNVKLNFDVVGMTHMDDFDDYFFEAEYEFVNYSTCDTGLRRHVGPSGDGVLSFHVPSTPLSEVPSKTFFGPMRCRWKIEAPTYKHLYLKFRGVNASSVEECKLGSRILVYIDPRAKPIANACISNDRSTREDIVEFDIFSHTWYNETSRDGGGKHSRDCLFVEMVSVHHDDPASFVMNWLEVTRPFVRTQSGQTLRNVDCQFECPEIGACIDPELWCDGTMHCPSGFDESPDHCRHFPVTYVACAAAGFFVVLAVLVWFTLRRRRLRRLLKKKKIRKFPPDDYCIESPIG